jgi:hypothetical protein
MMISDEGLLQEKYMEERWGEKEWMHEYQNTLRFSYDSMKRYEETIA